MFEPEVKEINELVGKVISKIEICQNEIIFQCSDLSIYKMYHNQRCYEKVGIDSIYGDINSLMYSTILSAKEYSGNSYVIGEEENTYAWSEYTFITIEGCVKITWYRNSVNYHADNVDFELIHPAVDVKYMPCDDLIEE